MSDVTTVRQLDFSDLYLGHPELPDRFSDAPGADANPLQAGPPLREDLDQLIEVCRYARRGVPEMAASKIVHDRVTYRVTTMRSMGSMVFILRKIDATIYSLAELGVPQPCIRQLMAKDMSGLFIVSGGIKAGKTMTACAMIKERLAAFGGVAITKEDTVELPLEGSHGHGVCYQTNASLDRHRFANEFRNWGARIMLIDEIRTPDEAATVLQASVNGYLIIATMLAEDVIRTVLKLYALANENLTIGGARSLLADGLAGVLHQTIIPESKPKLKTEFLYLNNAPSTRTVLRHGRYDLLVTDIRQQMALTISGHAVLRK